MENENISAFQARFAILITNTPFFLIFIAGNIFDINILSIIGGCFYIIAWIASWNGPFYRPVQSILFDFIIFPICLIFIKPWYMGLFWACFIMYWLTFKQRYSI